MELRGKKIILCSNSPRRRELLAGLGIEFQVDTRSNFEEHFSTFDLHPELVPKALAIGKSNGFHRPLEDDEILITSDTLVICEGRIMGKPSGADEARDMLRFLSGKTHLVTTAVCIRDSRRMETSSDTAKVTFTTLSDDEINYYIENYKPFDKAGAYGIQEWIGYIGIPEIQGSFYTIMGFPTHLVYELLSHFI
ncbi:MAG: septum formation protein Maf [Bacteroidales bacterium]|nr:septum formation protein Maf [Bacteroidales bacterium]